MKRLVVVLALVAAGAASAASADGPPLDAPIEHEGAIAIVEVHDGVIRDVEGVVSQVTGGAYLPHTSLVEVAQKLARYQAENTMLKVLIGTTIAIAVAAASLAAYEFGAHSR